MKQVVCEARLARGENAHGKASSAVKCGPTSGLAQGHYSRPAHSHNHQPRMWLIRLDTLKEMAMDEDRAQDKGATLLDKQAFKHFNSSVSSEALKRTDIDWQLVTQLVTTSNRPIGLVPIRRPSCHCYTARALPVADCRPVDPLPFSRCPSKPGTPDTGVFGTEQRPFSSGGDYHGCQSLLGTGGETSGCK